MLFLSLFLVSCFSATRRISQGLQNSSCSFPQRKSEGRGAKFAEGLKNISKSADRPIVGSPTQPWHVSAMLLLMPSDVGESLVALAQQSLTQALPLFP